MRHHGVSCKMGLLLFSCMCGCSVHTCRFHMCARVCINIGVHSCTHTYICEQKQAGCACLLLSKTHISMPPLHTTSPYQRFPAQVRKGDKLRLYNKGAAEWVLQRCTAMHDPAGDVVPMSSAAREELTQVGLQGINPRLRDVVCWGRLRWFASLYLLI